MIIPCILCAGGEIRARGSCARLHDDSLKAVPVQSSLSILCGYLPFVQVCHLDCFRLRRSAVHFTALPISCFACACFVFVSGLEGVKAVAMTPALFGPIHLNS